jgi:N-acetylglutamate synthase-like GNAT family acetyltransferase
MTTRPTTIVHSSQDPGDSESMFTAPGPEGQELSETRPVVRPGSFDDADAAWRLWHAHQNWINVSFAAQDVVQHRTVYEHMVMAFEQYPSAVAEVDDVVVGFAITEYAELDVLQITTVYVDNAYRNDGLGQQLIEEIEQLANMQGTQCLIAYASSGYFPDKLKPESLFRRAGFNVIDLSKIAQLYVKPLEKEDEPQVRRITLGGVADLREQMERVPDPR